MSAFKELEQRFTSGNDVPVSSIALSRDLYERLRAENEALRKDAERYQKLKQTILMQPGGQYAFSTWMGWHPDTFIHGFDEAIDRAIKG